jgi:hypothetical protein
LIFRKKKYYFNPVSLTFEEIKINKAHRLRMMLIFVVAAIFITAGSGYLLNQLFGSKETRILEHQLSSLKTTMNHLFHKGNELTDALHKDIFTKDNTYRTILQMDTVDLALRTAGTGGSAEPNEMAMKNDLTYQVNDVIKSLNDQLKIQSGSLAELHKKALEYSAEQTHLPAILPVAECDLIMISTDFGERSDPFFFIKRIHNGLDFVAPPGKNVFATGDGYVTFVEYSRKGYGNEIVINHKFGFSSRYAHLSAIKVKEGERVKRGQIIGAVGSTGRATGPHLHYEVLLNGKPVNPSYYFDTSLTQEEYAQIINKAN